MFAAAHNSHQTRPADTIPFEIPGQPPAANSTPMLPATPFIYSPAPPAPDPSAKQPAFVPAFGRPVQLQYIPRPADDEKATADTVGWMAALSRTDSQAPNIRAAAAAAIRGTNPTDQAAQVRAIHRWIRARVHFAEDSELAAHLAGFSGPDTEVLIRPADLLAMPRPAGDCDDYSMLAAAMLRAAGIPAALRTIAANPASSDYSHVYAIAHTPNGDLVMDASHGPRVGWEAPRTGKGRQWEIEPAMLRGLADLRSGDYGGEYGPPDTLYPISTAPVSIDGGGGDWWHSIVINAAKTGGDIARMVATPQGYYQQTTPQGTTTLRQQEGAAAFSLPQSTLTGSGSTLIIVALAAGAALFAIKAISK